MQRKKINILLILAVALIWGVVLYRYIAPFYVKKEVVFAGNDFIGKPQIQIKKKDTINLIFLERDPFLGKISSGERIAPVEKKAMNKVKAKKEERIVWPKIEYLGFVKSESSKARLELIRIDGRLYRVYGNSFVKNLKIKNSDNEKIQITNGHEERTFKKL